MALAPPLGPGGRVVGFVCSVFWKLEFCGVVVPVFVERFLYGCLTVVGRLLDGFCTVVRLVFIIVVVLFFGTEDFVGLVLGNATQLRERVNHPECARVLALHKGVGGVLGPFTCGFRASRPSAGSAWVGVGWMSDIPKSSKELLHTLLLLVSRLACNPPDNVL